MALLTFLCNLWLLSVPAAADPESDFYSQWGATDQELVWNDKNVYFRVAGHTYVFKGLADPVSLLPACLEPLVFNWLLSHLGGKGVFHVASRVMQALNTVSQLSEQRKFEDTEYTTVPLMRLPPVISRRLLIQFDRTLPGWEIFPVPVIPVSQKHFLQLPPYQQALYRLWEALRRIDVSRLKIRSSGDDSNPTMLIETGRFSDIVVPVNSYRKSLESRLTALTPEPSWSGYLMPRSWLLTDQQSPQNFTHSLLESDVLKLVAEILECVADQNCRAKVLIKENDQYHYQHTTPDHCANDSEPDTLCGDYLTGLEVSDESEWFIRLKDPDGWLEPGRDVLIYQNRFSEKKDILNQLDFRGNAWILRQVPDFTIVPRSIVVQQVAKLFGYIHELWFEGYIDPEQPAFREEDLSRALVPVEIDSVHDWEMRSPLAKEWLYGEPVTTTKVFDRDSEALAFPGMPEAESLNRALVPVGARALRNWLDISPLAPEFQAAVTPGWIKAHLAAAGPVQTPESSGKSSSSESGSDSSSSDESDSSDESSDNLSDSSDNTDRGVPSGNGDGNKNPEDISAKQNVGIQPNTAGRKRKRQDTTEADKFARLEPDSVDQDVGLNQEALRVNTRKEKHEGGSVTSPSQTRNSMASKELVRQKIPSDYDSSDTSSDTGSDTSSDTDTDSESDSDSNTDSEVSGLFVSIRVILSKSVLVQTDETMGTIATLSVLEQGLDDIDLSMDTLKSVNDSELLEELKDQISEIRKRFADFKLDANMVIADSVSAWIERNQELRGQLVEAECKINKLEKQLEGSAKKNQRQLAKHSIAAQALISEQTELRKSRQKADEAQVNIELLEQEVIEKVEKIELLNNELCKLRDERGHNRSQLENLKTELLSLKEGSLAVSAGYEKEIQDIRQAHNSFWQSLNKLDELLSEQPGRAMLEHRQTSREHSEITIPETLSAFRVKIEQYSQSVAQLQKKLKDSNVDVSKLSRQICTEEKEKAGLEKEVSTLKKKLTKLEEELGSVKTSEQKLVQEQVNRSGKIAQMEESIKRISDEFTKSEKLRIGEKEILEKALEEYKKSETLLQKKAQHLEEKNKELHEDKIPKLEQRLSNAQQDLEHWQKSHENFITSSSEEVKTLKNNIHGLKDKVRDERQGRSAAEEKVKELEEYVEKLEQGLTAEQERVSDLSKELSINAQKEKALEEERDGVLAKIKELEKNREEGRREAETLHQEHKQQLLSEDNKIKKLTKKINDLISGHQRELEQLKTRLAEKEQALNDVKSVSEVSNSVSSEAYFDDYSASDPDDLNGYGDHRTIASSSSIEKSFCPEIPYQSLSPIRYPPGTAITESPIAITQPHSGNLPLQQTRRKRRSKEQIRQGQLVQPVRKSSRLNVNGVSSRSIELTRQQLHDNLEDSENGSPRHPMQLRKRTAPGAASGSKRIHLTASSSSETDSSDEKGIFSGNEESESEFEDSGSDSVAELAGLRLQTLAKWSQHHPVNSEYEKALANYALRYRQVTTVIQKFKQQKLPLPVYESGALAEASTWSSGHINYLAWKHWHSVPDEERKLPFNQSSPAVKFMLKLLRPDHWDYETILKQHFRKELAIGESSVLIWTSKLSRLISDVAKRLKRSSIQLPKILEQGSSTHPQWTADVIRRLLEIDNLVFISDDDYVQRRTPGLTAQLSKMQPGSLEYNSVLYRLMEHSQFNLKSIAYYHNHRARKKLVEPIRLPEISGMDFPKGKLSRAALTLWLVFYRNGFKDLDQSQMHSITALNALKMIKDEARYQELYNQFLSLMWHYEYAVKSEKKAPKDLQKSLGRNELARRYSMNEISELKHKLPPVVFRDKTLYPDGTFTDNPQPENERDSEDAGTSDASSVSSD